MQAPQEECHVEREVPEVEEQRELLGAPRAAYDMHSKASILGPRAPEGHAEPETGQLREGIQPPGRDFQ